MAPRQSKRLSTIDVARMLGVAVSSVSKWIDEGKLAAGRTPGGHRRVEPDDLVRFLQQQGLRIPPELTPPRRKILIVDDDAPFAQWLSEEVRERFPDCEVALAHDGYAAGEAIGLCKPAVVILDLRMPGIDGFEVCRRIKANPVLKSITVIAVTGDDAPDSCARIMGLGAVACLGKPPDLPALFAELAKVWGGP